MSIQIIVWKLGDRHEPGQQGTAAAGRPERQTGPAGPATRPESRAADTAAQRKARPEELISMRTPPVWRGSRFSPLAVNLPSVGRHSAMAAQIALTEDGPGSYRFTFASSRGELSGRVTVGIEGPPDRRSLKDREQAAQNQILALSREFAEACGDWSPA